MSEVKWCFVPTCLNSTRNTVDKWFVPIPNNLKRREMWFKAVNRNYCFNSERSVLYCCSDHFNLEEDTESFFERNNEVVVKLKKSIVPRLSSLSSSKPLSTIVVPPKTAILIDPLPTSKPGAASRASSAAKDLPRSETTESDEEDDVVSVVTSEKLNAKNALMSKPKVVTKIVSNSPGSFVVNHPSTSKGLKNKTNARMRQGLKSPAVGGAATNLNLEARQTKQNVKTLMETLRRSIPSIAYQQGLTREKIMDEAVEFINQMRNKSDKRQSSMHFVMESNNLLSAKIQHLEHLMSLHEKNEIVLTKEIVDRRLGAVSTQKPASLSVKQTRTRMRK